MFLFSSVMQTEKCAQTTQTVSGVVFVPHSALWSVFISLLELQGDCLVMLRAAVAHSA